MIQMTLAFFPLSVIFFIMSFFVKDKSSKWMLRIIFLLNIGMFALIFEVLKGCQWAKKRAVSTF